MESIEGGALYCGDKKYRNRAPPPGTELGSRGRCFKRGIGIGMMIEKTKLPDFNRLSLRELGKYAALMKVRGYSTMRRAELIEILSDMKAEIRAALTQKNAASLERRRMGADEEGDLEGEGKSKARKHFEAMVELLGRGPPKHSPLARFAMVHAQNVRDFNREVEFYDHLIDTGRIEEARVMRPQLQRLRDAIKHGVEMYGFKDLPKIGKYAAEDWSGAKIHGTGKARGGRRRDLPPDPSTVVKVPEMPAVDPVAQYLSGFQQLVTTINEQLPSAEFADLVHYVQVINQALSMAPPGTPHDDVVRIYQDTIGDAVDLFTGIDDFLQTGDTLYVARFGPAMRMFAEQYLEDTAEPRDHRARSDAFDSKEPEGDVSESKEGSGRVRRRRC